MRTYEGDDQRWEVYLSDERPHEGVRPVVFRCTSNSSFGWRVVEVPAGEFEDGRLEAMEESELTALFERAQPFGYAHDPKAREGTIGDTPTR